MRGRLRVWLLACAALLALWQGAVLAQGAPGAVSSNDTKALQQVIRDQLAAFAQDDAARAFSYATPGIRGVFGTPENFMAMVRTSYPVVYRPASVIFLKPEQDGDQVLQPVQMSDSDGIVWIALYTMQRQGNGAWLTNGCQLARSRGQVT